MNEKLIRPVVVVVDLFEAVSALLGAAGLIVGFIGIPVTILTGTPFADFTMPALLLGCVVGGSALAAAVIAMFGPRQVDALATAVAGCVTVGWMTVEIAMIGLGIPAQVVWFYVGLVMIGLAALLWLAEARPAASGSHQPIKLAAPTRMTNSVPVATRAAKLSRLAAAVRALVRIFPTGSQLGRPPRRSDA